jgi:type IV pilus assembly protein PilZ
MVDGSEKRQAERAAITLRVDYKRLNTFFADYTKNISKGGTFIATEKPLEGGTEFVFALDLPGLGEPLRLHGRVMWTTTTDEASKANPAGMGIEFIYSSAEERRATEAIVEKLLVGQLGEHLTDKLLKRT